MGNATSALVDKDFVSIISNKTRHYKMAATAVHSYEPTLPTPPTLFSELVFFLCTVKVSLLSPTLAPTFKYLLRPKFDILVNGVFVVSVVALQIFPVIISIIPKINVDWSVNKK